MHQRHGLAMIQNVVALAILVELAKETAMRMMNVMGISDVARITVEPNFQADMPIAVLIHQVI